MAAKTPYNAETLPHLRPFREWTLEIEKRPGESRHEVTHRIDGSGLECRTMDGGTREFVVQRPFDEFKVAEITADGTVTAFGCAGGLVPVFADAKATTLRLSNVASRLFSGGKIQIGFESFAQQLHGVNYPNDELFPEIKMLLASVGYSWTGQDLLPSRNLVATSRTYTVEHAIQLIETRFEAIARTGRPLLVLVSGGYDSRLNLAMALRCRKVFGNEIHLFHEFKNQSEFEIAAAVAAAAGLPLHTKTRNDFVPAIRPVFLHPGIVESNSGTYRDNLVRWSLYFDWIQRQFPTGILIGFGAEAHKGKFYRQVLDPVRDARRVFQLDPLVIQSIGQSLGVRDWNRHSQDALFDRLLGLAGQIRSPSGQVDFVHYQTYVAYGYGRRGFFCQEQFSIPMPMLDNEFLQVVFSLAREEKEGFRVVKEAIRKFAPELDAVPYTSANAKSLEEKKSDPARWLRRGAIKLFGNRAYSLGATFSREGRTQLTPTERDYVSSISPRSEITARLVHALRAPDRDVPKLRTEYAMQMLVYLATLEARHKVEFVVV